VRRDIEITVVASEAQVRLIHSILNLALLEYDWNERDALTISLLRDALDAKLAREAARS